MTNNKPPGLYLRIESEPWEMECSVCHGKGYYYIAMPYSGNEPPRTSCGYCHGTGHVRKRLTGAVEVQVQLGERYPGHHSYIWYATLDNIYDAGEFSTLIELIIAAFRANTLPPDLLYDADKRPWGLKEMDVE